MPNTQLTEAIIERVKSAAIQAGRDPDEIRIIGVCKQQAIANISRALTQGISDLGENYLQEALEHQGQLNFDHACWHFIGAIQSNKSAAVAAQFDWVHTVDRLKIARRLSQHRAQTGKPPLQVLIQVNLDAEDSKAGIEQCALAELAQAIEELDHLSLRGLMIIPAPRESERAQKQIFAATRELMLKVNRELNLQMDTLSMGMSADFETAISEGATMVRIGTALFGARVK